MRLLRVVTTLPAENDLSWYLNEAQAAAGIRSSYGVLVDAAMGGWGSGRNDPHAGRTRGYRDKETGDHKHPWLDNVARERRLHARWGTLSETDQGILSAAYVRERFPRETERPLGDLVRVGLMTAAFRAAYDERGTPIEWLADLCRRGKRQTLIDEIRRQALALIETPLVAWRATARFLEEDPEEVERRAVRFEAASRDVAGPERDEAPRTWTPDEAGRGSWMSAREGAEPCEAGDQKRCLGSRVKRRRGDCEAHVTEAGKCVTDEEELVRMTTGAARRGQA